ncbi:MAG TPA: FAD-dependent oxidoreductase [Microlunatus sp.]|nr:FAD-dependent oxidoreductase [Microlunatus sp.]
MPRRRGPEPTVFDRRAPNAAAVEHALAGASHQVFWLDGLSRPTHPELIEQHAADLVVVGAGYTGLWTAIRARERDPGRRVIVLEAGQVGWAASGRNGGFCEASLTHGEENGRSRWSQEYDLLERLGRDNLAGIAGTVDRYRMDVELERTGTLSVATEQHQVAWLEGDDGFLDGPATRRLVDSPTFLAGSWDRDDTVLVHPGKLVLELARVATDLGVQIFEQSRVEVVDDGPVVRTAHGEVHADQVVLATNVFPSLLRRNRLQTVPVYDYVLVTEPLSAEQKAAVGWQGRQGVADLANHFHYYRLTADDRILFGGYDAVYHWGGKVRAAYEDRPETYAKLASHLLTTFPQLEGIRISHRWAGAIDTCSRFCAFFGTARQGRVAYAAGFTGLGVGASRFAADVVLDLLGGTPTERTELAMVRERPLPFPPEPLAWMGIRLTDWSMHRADRRQGRRNLLLKGLDAVGMGFDS